MSRQVPLQELVAFDGGEHSVLSAYLNLEPARQIRRTYRVAFADLVKKLQAQLDEGAREALEREAAQVTAYLETEAPHGKGLAVFSCSPLELWRVIHLPVAVADNVQLGRKPYLRPLLDVLDEYERYAVALVDKEKARLFTVLLGEIEEHRRISDFVPGKHDQGGLSQANYQRHHEAHVYHHLKRVAEDLSDLLQRRPFDRLVLAGPEEVTSELRRVLPRSLRTRLVATIPAEIFAGEAEILEKTLAIEREAERKEEERLVGEVLETAAAGGLATTGVDSTLEAVWHGRVHRLIVAENLSQSGSECPDCARLALDVPQSCPLCGAKPMPLADVVERAVERTLEENGTVEVVHGEPARRLTEAGGGLSAILRY